MIVTAWAALAAMFTLVALVRLAKRRPSPPGRARGVLLLRPVDAVTGGELRNLEQVPRGVEQLVISPRPITAGAHLPSDPPSQNRKLGHLKHALKEVEGVSGDSILVADADVAVDDALVSALLGAIDAGADLAWAAPRPAARGVVRGLLVQSMHSFEVLEVMSGGAKPVCGKAMALSPRAQRVLLELPDCIGEDLELSRALHARGLTVTQAGHAPMPHGEPALSAVIARFTRWMQVLRIHRPALFPTVPLLFACTPFLFAAAQLWGGLAERAAVATLISLRLVAASVLERRRGLYVAWLGAELLLAGCWLKALVAGRRVVWRGRVLELESR